jgi:DNA invertase Pin-like site-specific DNA recombinase
MQNPPTISGVRCAIYTRKSTTAHLDSPFNTLETQREVCGAYIRSQLHRGWVELPARYDDGGFSGGSLERPALRRLIDDIEAGRIDMVVVYKIDRLSRSLSDFIRLIETLDRYDVSFVSVTQTFDTSDSMGRLVLNILLTFAQFERELASDRSRDKKAALMRRGLFVGGTPPFGYLLGPGGRLILDPERAHIVSELFHRFPEVNASQLARELASRGCRSQRYITKGGVERGGWPLYTNRILKILSNPIYTGHIVHRGDWIEAAFEPLVSREQWDLVQEVRRTRFPMRRDPVRNCLIGILHDEHGRRMKVQKGTGRARASRYYKSEHASWSRDGVTRRIMVDADRVEKLTVATLQAFLSDRIELKRAILSLGLYSDGLAKSLRKGQLASRRIDAMSPEGLRSFLMALVARAEVTTKGLSLWVRCHEVARFLIWDGISAFTRDNSSSSRRNEKVYELSAPSFIVCGHPRFALPIDPCPTNVIAKPESWLVDLLQQAAEYRSFMLDNRDKSMAELARAKRLGPSTFARILRLNYLAPDIQAAIIDGRQPADLSVHDMLYGAMPLDWGQQRKLLGFDT